MIDCSSDIHYPRSSQAPVRKAITGDHGMHDSKQRATMPKRKYYRHHTPVARSTAPPPYSIWRAFSPIIPSAPCTDVQWGPCDSASWAAAWLWWACRVLRGSGGDDRNRGGMLDWRWGRRRFSAGVRQVEGDAHGVPSLAGTAALR